MDDWLVETFTSYPYLGVAVVFLACGLGFPLPEEIILIAAGYVCFAELADLVPMILVCSGAILAGDLVPFLLGRIFGVRLLRIRPLRLLANRHRLATFDRWFRKRGDLVIFFARFMTGLRVVAYFTAGTMRMSVLRFITLDLMGIALVVPLFVGLGYTSGDVIDEVVAFVKAAERGVLIAVLASALAVLLWWMLRRRRQRRSPGASDTFVGPSVKPSSDPEEAGDDDATPPPQ